MQARSAFRILALAAALSAFAFSLSDCGKVPSTAPASGTFGSVYLSMQTSSCSQCHVPAVSGQAANGAKFDVTSQSTAYASLVSKNVSGQSTSGCNSAVLVTPGSPTASYLLATLFSDYRTSFPVSGCAPYNGHTVGLSDDEKASFVAWIQNGAKND